MSDDAPHDHPNISREELERYARGEDVEPSTADAISSNPDLVKRIENMREENEFLDEFVSAMDHSTHLSPELRDEEDVDGYEIIREIARGSQGIVVEALQTSTNRRVALKLLIRGTFATSRERDRFEREVELVAAMPHPGIVTVHDSGLTSGGRAYVAMELVEGMTLSEWASSVLQPPIGISARSTSP